MNGDHRVRVGLMIPSSNTVMEVDFVRQLPPEATLHTARMFMEATTVEGESRMLDDFALPAARDLATARPHVVVFGCTSAGALRGDAYDTQLCQRISDVTGAPTVSTVRSVREAIVASGARRVGIFTPYVDDLNERIKASVEADGVEVVKIAGLGIDENFQIAQVPPTTIIDSVVASLGGLDIDLGFVSCTNFRAFEVLPVISEKLGIPVISSNQAVLAATLRIVSRLLAA